MGFPFPHAYCRSLFHSSSFFGRGYPVDGAIEVLEDRLGYRPSVKIDSSKSEIERNFLYILPGMLPNSQQISQANPDLLLL